MPTLGEEVAVIIKKLDLNSNRLDSLSDAELNTLFTFYAKDAFRQAMSKERAWLIGEEINSRRSLMISTQGIELAKRGTEASENAVSLTRFAMILTGIAVFVGLLQTGLIVYQIHLQVDSAKRPQTLVTENTPLHKSLTEKASVFKTPPDQAQKSQ